MGHETFRRELLTHTFSVYVDVGVWSGEVEVDFTPAVDWIEELVEAIYEVVKDIVDAALAVYRLVRSVIEACESCDRRLEQTFCELLCRYLPSLSLFILCYVLLLCFLLLWHQGRRWCMLYGCQMYQNYAV